MVTATVCDCLGRQSARRERLGRYRAGPIAGVGGYVGRRTAATERVKWTESTGGGGDDGSLVTLGVVAGRVRQPRRQTVPAAAPGQCRSCESVCPGLALGPTRHPAVHVAPAPVFHLGTEADAAAEMPSPCGRGWHGGGTLAETVEATDGSI